MPYTAVALARTPDGWNAQEVDLDGVSDIDEVDDLIREVDPDAYVTLLFVEQDDEYVAIVRLDADAEEPRVFVSDGRAADTYPLVQMLADAIDESEASGGGSSAPVDELDADAPPGHDAEPLGDADLLADLGTRRRDLLALCAQEGTLPSDVITEVCERAGCLDELEALRVP